MDVGAIQAASVATTASYRSFADATRSVLDLLEAHLPDATLFLSHLDRSHTSTASSTRAPASRSACRPTRRRRCATPTAGGWPRTWARAAATTYAPTRSTRASSCSSSSAPCSYLGVPLELSDGSRVGSLAALSRTPSRFTDADEQLFGVLARVLSPSSSARARARPPRMTETLREHARGLAALGRVTKALSGSRDARPAVCRAACEVTCSPVAFLLEPSGREFVSTAMVGVDIAPVTIQPRAESGTAAARSRRARRYFVADARSHPGARGAAGRGHRRALGAVRAGAARRAGRRRADRDLAGAGGGAPRRRRRRAAALLAAQAAVAIEHAGCARGSARSRSPIR